MNNNTQFMSWLYYSINIDKITIYFFILLINFYCLVLPINRKIMSLIFI